MSASRVALVTGGAYGIGRGIVEAFARHGERAVIADRDRVRGAELEASLRAEGHDVLFVETDVREEEQIRAAVASVAEVFERIDVLVNNAGIFKATPLDDLDPDLVDQLFALNVKAVLFLSAAERKNWIAGGVALAVGAVIYATARGPRKEAPA